MSTIQKIEIEGYRSVGAKQVIDLSRPGLVLMTGDNRDRGRSSGAGKSTLFKAITTSLFEECDDGSIKGNGINVLQKEKGLRIGINFAGDDGTPYYAVYSYLHPTDGSDWYLWQWDGKKWNDKREEKKGDTKGLIQKILRMDYGQFVNRAYMAQETVAEFIWRTQAERIKIFSGILNLGAIDIWVQSARDWKKDTDKELTGGKGKTALFDSQIAKLKANLKTDTEVRALQDAVVQVDARMAAVENELEARREDAKTISALIAVKANQRAQQGVVDSLKQKKVALGAEPVPNGVSEATVKMAKEGLEAADLKHSEWNGKLRAAQQRLAEVESLGEACGACEQPINDATRRKLLESYVRQVKSVEVSETSWRTRKTGHKAEYERVKDQWDTIYRKQCDHHKLDADIRKATGVLDSYTSQIEDMRRILGDAVDYPDKLNAEFRALTDQQITLTRERAVAQVALNAAFEAIDQYQGLLADRAAQEETNNALEERITYLKKIDTLLGDKGFRSYKIKSSRVAFNQSLSRYLSILTDGEVEAELVTEVPRADGKGTKQELDILIRDGEKIGVPIRQYSGGEKATLSVSITGAFWDLAVSQSGGGVNILLLDEPFAQMDDFGIQKACRLLESMREGGKIILVVTNEPKVRDLGMWDREIRAVKEHNITRFEEYDLSSSH
jgi:DNA repair exonuclease SbcCD ATPase subunit